MEAVEKLILTSLPHPPRSPGLAPCDLHLLPKIKKVIRGHLCASDEAVEGTIMTLMKKHSVEFFSNGFEELVLRWRKCVENGGDYV